MRYSSKQWVILLIGSIGVAVTFSFAIIRFLNEQYLVGFVDLLITCPILAIVIYVCRTRETYYSSIALAVVAALGAVSSAALLGSSQAFWIFPAVLTIYYLIRPLPALAISTAASLAYVFIMSSTMESFEFSAFITTISVSNLFAFIFSKSMHDTQDSLEKLAILDPLTGCGNRRALDQKLKEVVLHQHRNPQPVSLIVLDLDHFKEVNDEFGHHIGDQILKEVVDLIRSRIRITDVFYRFGGEEFVIVPLSVSLEEASVLAEDIRVLCEKHTFEHDIRLTISLGLAQFKQGESYDHWFQRADKALYRAKENGRNRVEF